MHSYSRRERNWDNYFFSPHMLLLLQTNFRRARTESDVNINDSILICGFLTTLVYMRLKTTGNSALEVLVSQETMILPIVHDHCFHFRNESHTIDSFALRFSSNSLKVKIFFVGRFWHDDSVKKFP